MSKQKIIAGALLAALIFLSACEDGGHFLFEDPSENVLNMHQSSQYGHHTVFFESAPMQLAMYEPSKGSFIGMYTDAFQRSDGRVIAAHEAVIGVRHAAFMEVMHIDGDFPLLWVLECIAEQKVPVIVILPPEEGDPFGNHWERTLTEAAIAFAEVPVPMFAVFYPVPPNPVWDVATYIAFFRYARAIFAIYAPHVAFVWTVDASKENFKENFRNYFPGNLAVDWVGLTLFSEALEVPEYITHFYNAFQRDKPIMLNLGLSHFSTEDHRYRIAETVAALEQIYHTIQREFPRVKMVNYMDVNRLDYDGHDYRISMDIDLQAAYRDSVRGFIVEFPRNFDDTLVIQPIRSAYSAYIEDGRIYLDIRIVTSELGLSVPGLTRWIGGAQRVDAALLDIRTEIERGHVWLR